MTEPCSYCPAEGAWFIGGAYFCDDCIRHFESLPVPSAEDVAEMESWHD